MSGLTDDNGVWRAKRKNRTTGKVCYFWFGKVRQTSRRQAMALWLTRYADLERADLEPSRAILRANLTDLERLASVKRLPVSAQVPDLPACVRLTADDDLDLDLDPTSTSTSTSTLTDLSPVSPIGKAIDLFLARITASVRQGKVSAGRLANIRTGIERFGRFVGKGSPLTAISGVRLSAYLGDLTATGTNAKNNLAVAKQFVRWLADLEVIVLPRIVESAGFQVSVEPPVIRTFNPEQLQSIVAGSDGLLRACLLLMANCGFTGKDCADVRQDEIDWTAGTITRKRSKTSRHDGVPTITYRLWRSTLTALGAVRQADGDRVLLNADGKPLVGKVLDELGKVQSTDCLRQQFVRLLVRLGIATDRTLKNIRKTSATLIADSVEYGRFAQYFLGHSPHTIADKHYIAPPTQERFDACIAWLGNKYKLS